MLARSGIPFLQVVKERISDSILRMMVDSASPASVQQRKATAMYHGALLAPMVRASTTPLRTLALMYGANLVYTEELIDRSVLETKRVINTELGTIDYVKDTSKLSAKQQRRMAKEGAVRLVLRIDRHREKGRLVCQLGTGQAALAVQAAEHVCRDVDAIDINMGCPKKFSVGGGMGSALLTDPTRACDIVTSVSQAMAKLEDPIPVSCKIRLLKDVPSTLKLVSSLIEAGSNAIAIHGRQVGDPEVQAADWESLKDTVRQASAKFPHIPFLINGDFYTRDEFTDFYQYGAKGVLLARPALYNTSIFKQPKEDAKDNGPYGYHSILLLDKTTVVQDYLREAVKYDTHYKNIKYVVCEMLNSRRAPHERVPMLKQSFPGGQTIHKTCNSHSLADICTVWDVDFETEVARRNGGNDRSTPAMVGEHTYLDSYILKSTGCADQAPDSTIPELSPPCKKSKRCSN